MQNVLARLKTKGERHESIEFTLLPYTIALLTCHTHPHAGFVGVRLNPKLFPDDSEGLFGSTCDALCAKAGELQMPVKE